MGGFGAARARAPYARRPVLPLGDAFMSLSVDAVGLHEVAPGVGVGAPRRSTRRSRAVRSFRVHLPSLAYDLGHGDVEAHETAPIAMEPAAPAAERNSSDAVGEAARGRRAPRASRAPARGAALELAAAVRVRRVRT